MINLLSLIVGGAVGTTSRYALSTAMTRMFGSHFPHGTLAVNLVGCFLIGLIAALAEEKFSLSEAARLFLMVGFLGAFTTFSTFILETAHLIQAGHTLRALVNVLASVMVGFLFFYAGVLLSKIF